MNEKDKAMLVNWLKQCDADGMINNILNDEELTEEFLEYAKKGKKLSRYTIWEICTYRD